MATWQPPPQGRATMATASPGTAPLGLLGLLGSPLVFPMGSWPGLGQVGHLLSEPLLGEV